MKYLKNFKLFENLESKIDLQELEDILIDFKQMGLDADIKVGSSVVIDWKLLNDDKTGGSKCLYPREIDKYTKSRTNNSLTIEFNTPEKHSYNIDDTQEAYEMLKDYLFDNYNLIPNYIYINLNWSYMYFEDFDKIKEHKSLFSDDTSVLGYEESTTLINFHPLHKLVFGFYEG